MISIDDFAKLDLRAAKVLAASRVEGSDKLLQLTLDLGTEQRNVFSGIARHYKPEDLVGRFVVMIANLAPRKMRFGVSEGMVLCASDKDGDAGGVFVLTADAGVQPGMKIDVKPERVVALYSALQAANPEPRSELEFHTPFELLVAVILSAQATDKSVNIATRRLYPAGQYARSDPRARRRRASRPSSATSACTTPRRRTSSKPAGCSSSAMVARCRANAPRSRPCPASAARRPTWCSTWPSASPRWRWTPTCSAWPTAPALPAAGRRWPWSRSCCKVTPPQFLQHAHHWLILHGRHVCLARTPKCCQCVIAASVRHSGPRPRRPERRGAARLDCRP